MTVTVKKRLGELLIERKLLTQEKLNEALKIQKETKEKLGVILVRLGTLSRDALLEILSAEMGIPAIKLSRYKLDPHVLSLLPKKIVELYCVMPISSLANTLTLAMADPLNIHALDDIHRLTHLEIHPLLAAEKDIKEAIEQYYGENVSQAIKDVIEDMTTEEGFQLEEGTAAFWQDTTTQELLRLTQEEPVVKLTNSILTESVRRLSSDIFIEPEEKAMRVRFRVDGILQEGVSTSPVMHPGVVSRIKVMSDLNIAEHRLPQDGRFKVKIQGKEIDFRVSVIPTYLGEKVVLRVLDKSQVVLDIDKLGFEPAPLGDFKKAEAHPYGMIIICGPTGSGKTTTLYSVLKLIDSPEKNFITVEDPVEYQLEGINQVAVRPEVNLTFAASLRAILRQDPDTIMVGEVRDAETADIAIKAALTGHLVLTTLHTNTAIGTVTRLVNMGVEPYLIVSSLLLAGAQRLVRRICARCKESYVPGPDVVRQLGITEKHVGSQKLVFHRGKGCDACAKKGYAGRIVVVEAFTLSPGIKDLIVKRAPEAEIKKLACKEGMTTLRESGITKILQGITTVEEVMRVTAKDN